MPADLHLHSIYSDGSLAPEELVELAARKHLRTIALSDHDTVAGIDEALKAGRKYNIEIIPAIELSSLRTKAEIHILGYYIDYRDEQLLSRIDEIFKARIKRAKKMIKRLNRLGVEITYEEAEAVAGDKYIGRPHIARAMVKAGYIQKMGEAFTNKYIGNNGQAYLPKYKISPEEAIKLIREAGGISVLAHPSFINHGDPMDKKRIRDLVDYGLMGIEVFHARMNKDDSKYYHRIADELGLLVTGGSDYHGENSPGIEIGDILLDDKYVASLESVKESLE